MRFLPCLPYPETEKPKLELLKSLFGDWYQHFANNGPSLVKHNADDMVFDGFYPYYFSQKTRMLFIGREPRQISGLNNMDVLYEAYRPGGKTIGDRDINGDNFHSRMLRIAYGITNGMPAWRDIPSASRIGDTFGDADGLSFAFMNISKLSNEADESAADWPVIKATYKLSTQDRNFIREEVAVLEPDIVITMNLMDNVEDELDSLGEWTAIYRSPAADSYWLTCGGHRSLVIETWHFAAWKLRDRRFDDEKDFYVPICDAIRRSEVAPLTVDS